MGGTNWTKLNLQGSKCVTKLLSTELSKSEHALHTTSLLKQTSFTFFLNKVHWKTSRHSIFSNSHGEKNEKNLTILAQFSGPHEQWRIRIFMKNQISGFHQIRLQLHCTASVIGLCSGKLSRCCFCCCLNLTFVADVVSAIVLIL